MPELLPEYLGYDRTIAVFSPDGRLFQVEYAKQAAKQGATILGLIYKDGVLIASSKEIDDLQVASEHEKIFIIDDHIALAYCGLVGDARYLTNLARIRAQNHRITYDEEIDVSELTRFLADRIQYSTMFGGLRPFGVMLLVGGIDKKGKHIFELDPSGAFYGWKALALGRGSEAAMKILRQKYKENLERDSAIKLALEVLKKVEKNVIIEILLIEEKIKKLTEAEIEKYLE